MLPTTPQWTAEHKDKKTYIKEQEKKKSINSIKSINNIKSIKK